MTNKDRYAEEVTNTFCDMYSSIDNINNLMHNRNKQLLNTSIEPPTAGALPPKPNHLRRGHCHLKTYILKNKHDIISFILFVILMYIINFIIIN